MKTTKVNTYNATGGFIEAGIPLDEAIPDATERAWAQAALDAYGNYTTGGGAAPRIKLVRAADDTPRYNSSKRKGA